MTKSLPIPLATLNPNLTQEAKEKKNVFNAHESELFFPLFKSQTYD
jgi:hypothetical protein